MKMLKEKQKNLSHLSHLNQLNLSSAEPKPSKPEPKPKMQTDDPKEFVYFEKEEVTLDDTKEIANFKNAEVAEIFTKIFNAKLPFNQTRKLLIGLLKKYYSKDPRVSDAVLLTRLYQDYNAFHGNSAEHQTSTILVRTENDFEGVLNNFLNDDFSKDVGERIDNLFNLEEDSDEALEDDASQADSFMDKLLDKDTKTLIKFEKLVDELLAHNGMTMKGDNPTPFSHIAKRLNGVLGPHLNKRIFYKLQGLYQLNTGRKVNKSYERTVQSISKIAEEQSKIQKQKEAIKVTDETSLSAEEIEAINIANIRSVFLKEEGELLPSNVVTELQQAEDEDIFYTSAKNLFPASSIAFRTLDYEITFDSERNLVDRKTRGNTILPVDPILMKDTGVKVGDKVEFFVVEDDVVYNDGRVYRNSKNNKGVWYTEIIGDFGKQTSPSTLDDAPIGIKINGKVVEDAYVHRPAFINSSTTVDALKDPERVEKERSTLRELRKRILNGEEITTTVTTRGRGHLYKKGMAKTALNLPNVRVAIYTGTEFITGGQVIPLYATS